MPGFVDPAVEAYAEAHTTAPPDHLVALEEETQQTMAAPQMLVGRLEGRFLELLVHMTQARRVLEIGTFTGYSALAMAAALPDGGSITTCEIDERHAEVARRHISRSPYASAIEVRLGPALDTVATLDGPFDLVFVDADKSNYDNYFEAVLPKLADSGVIAFDNTLWSGQVLDEGDSSADTTALRALNDKLRDDRRVVAVLLTVRDGVTLVRKR